MRRVILESPYAGQTAIHSEYALKCARDSLSRDESPIASHILFAIAGVLDDSRPEQRTLGIEAGHAWISVAEAMVVYCDKGISDGMRKAMNIATMLGITIEKRSLYTPKENPV